MNQQQPSSVQADAESNNDVQPRTPEQVAQQVLDEREARVFRASSKPVRVGDISLPDSFFEPSAGELKNAVGLYARESQKLSDGVMKTAKMRQAEVEQRMKRFRKVLIRIVLPDRVALQGIFTPRTPIRQVVRFVRAALLDARNVKFHLFVVPPKRILAQLDATLWDEGLVPAAIVHAGIETGPTVAENLLKQHLLAGMEDAPETTTPSPETKTSNDKKGDDKNEKDAGQVADVPKTLKPRKIPKWFKK